MNQQYLALIDYQAQQLGALYDYRQGSQLSRKAYAWGYLPLIDIRKLTYNYLY
jgi:hypothetical protein